MPPEPPRQVAAGDAPSLTPRDAAKAMIRPYILRGDSLDALAKGMMGHAGSDYQAQIGGHTAIDGKTTKIKAGHLAVTRIGETPVSARFALRGLAEEIRREAAEAHQRPSAAPEMVEEPIEASSIHAAINRDPAGTLPHSRLPDDFWNEYVNEYEYRERNLMAPVGPEEFADIRDFADGDRTASDLRARADFLERNGERR